MAFDTLTFFTTNATFVTVTLTTTDYASALNAVQGYVKNGVPFTNSTGALIYYPPSSIVKVTIT